MHVVATRGHDGQHDHCTDCDDTRNINYAQQMFKDNRFKGDLSQDISEVLHLYDICARQYRDSPLQKADLFIYIFDGCSTTTSTMEARLACLPLAFGIRMVAGKGCVAEQETRRAVDCKHCTSA